MTELEMFFDVLYKAGMNDHQIAERLKVRSNKIWRIRNFKGLPPHSPRGRAAGSRSCNDTLCLDCQNARADRCIKFVRDDEKDWAEYKRFKRENWGEYEEKKKIYKWKTPTGVYEKVWNIEVVKQCKKFIPDGAVNERVS